MPDVLPKPPAIPYELMAVAAIKRRRELVAAVLHDESDWRTWLRAYFPLHVRADFAPHQSRFWDWAWNVGTPAQKRQAPAFVNIWSRGGGKSSSLELFCAAMAARGKRAYGLYLSRTQAQANDHVATVASMFESRLFGERYARSSSRRVGQNGRQMGWSQTTLRTQSGFALDAISLQTGIRGAKDEERRPDFLIIDDIDEAYDSDETIAKLEDLLKKSILGALTLDGAIVVVGQNLIHAAGIVSRISNGKADFLTDRIINGPIPALNGFEYDRYTRPDGSFGYRITGGEPTWVGQGIAECEQLLNRIGPTAFLQEAQQQVGERLGGMFDGITFRHMDINDIARVGLTRRAVCVDPAVTNTDHSDANGIVSGGRDKDGNLYVFRAFEGRMEPLATMLKAIQWAHLDGAQHLIVETDQGGDTWHSVYRESCKLLGMVPWREDVKVGPVQKVAPRFVARKAGSTQEGKAERVQHLVPTFEAGRIWFAAGHCSDVENGLRRFPKFKPFDCADALYWLHQFLLSPAPGWETVPMRYEPGYAKQERDIPLEERFWKTKTRE